MLPDRLLQKVAKLQIYAPTSVDKQTQTLPTPQSVRNDAKPAPKGGIFSGTAHAHPAAPNGRDASTQSSFGQPPVPPSAVTLPVSGTLFGTPAQTGRPLFGGSTPTQPASGSLFGGLAPTQPVSGSVFGNPAQTGRSLFGGSLPTQPASSGLFGGSAPTQPVSSGFFGRENTNARNSITDGATLNSSSGPGLFGSHRPVASPDVDASTPTTTNVAKPLTSKYLILSKEHRLIF